MYRITSRYGLEGPGIESAPFRTGRLSPLYNWCRVISGGKAVGAWC